MCYHTSCVIQWYNNNNDTLMSLLAKVNTNLTVYEQRAQSCIIMVIGSGGFSQVKGLLSTEGHADWHALYYST